MADLLNVKVLWENFPGAPGYSNFYFESAGTPPLAALTTFFSSQATRYPTGLTIHIPNSGDIFDESTGLLSGAWSGGTAGNVISTALTTTDTGSAGAVVNWITTGIHAGRRVRGRTFMVPLHSGVFGNGNLLPAAQTAIQTAADALVAAAGADMRVWHRPVDGAGGSAFAVTGARVPSLAAVLRSRRD